MLAEDARFLEYWFMGFINKDKKIINAVWDVVSLVTQLKMSIGGGGDVHVLPPFLSRRGYCIII